MPGDKHQYYSKRAAEERAIAESATDSCAKAVHVELAERYETLAAGKQLSRIGKIERPSADRHADDQGDATLVLHLV